MKKSVDDRIRVAYLMHGARNVGGGERSVYLLIKYLNRDLFEPIVFYARKNEIIFKLEAEEAVSLHKIPLSDKITSVYRDEIKFGPLAILAYMRHMLVGVAAVVKALKEKKVSILHPHDNLSKIIGSLAAKITGVRVVANCHDLLENSFVEKALIFYQLLFLDRIIAVSEAARKRFAIRNKIPNKVLRVYNGIEIGQFLPGRETELKKKLGVKSGHLVLGIVGLFDACKGHIYLLRAIESLVTAGRRDFVCLVIGDGREAASLTHFVEERQLTGHIKFLGYRNDVANLLKVIDIFVVPSLQESFGIVAIEAAAMEVPVIATRVGGLPECVADGTTGILVPPENVESLVHAIHFLMSNPAVRCRMGKAGRRKVAERFSAESNARETERMYLDVVKNV